MHGRGEADGRAWCAAPKGGGTHQPPGRVDRRTMQASTEKGMGRSRCWNRACYDRAPCRSRSGTQRDGMKIVRRRTMIFRGNALPGLTSDVIGGSPARFSCSVGANQGNGRIQVLSRFNHAGVRFVRFVNATTWDIHLVRSDPGSQNRIISLSCVRQTFHILPAQGSSGGWPDAPNPPRIAHVSVTRAWTPQMYTCAVGYGMLMQFNAGASCVRALYTELRCYAAGSARDTIRRVHTQGAWRTAGPSTSLTKGFCG